MTHSTVSLAPEVDPFVIAKIGQLLRPEIQRATGKLDLRRRLGAFGFDLKSGYLVTAPQGKMICPISQI